MNPKRAVIAAKSAATATHIPRFRAGAARSRRERPGSAGSTHTSTAEPGGWAATAAWAAAREGVGSSWAAPSWAEPAASYRYQTQGANSGALIAGVVVLALKLLAWVAWRGAAWAFREYGGAIGVSAAAVVVAAMIGLEVVVRRRWRMVTAVRDGVCPACGYDLAGSDASPAWGPPACPEWGCPWPRVPPPVPGPRGQERGRVDAGPGT
jgi:hypothetical protein